MATAEEAHTPVEICLVSDQKSADVPCREAAGFLIQLIVGIRSDIGCPVCRLAKLVENPTLMY